IYVENTDGSTTQITNDSYEDSYPQLSSDGRKVVFTSMRQGANGPNSIVVRDAVNTLAPEQVLPMPPGATNVWDPTFSPDGSMIAVEASDYDGVTTTFHGIVLMDADGSNAHPITNAYSATCDCWDGYPAFTPDSSQIVFDGFSQAWFQAPATAAHARGTIRPRHGHTLESQSPAQRLLQGFKW